MFRFRKSLLYLAAIPFLASCKDVYFTEAQPVTSAEMQAFPREVVGKWIAKGESDTLVITARCFSSKNDNGIFDFYGVLGNDHKLTRLNTMHYLNVRNPENNYWHVYAFDLKQDSLRVFAVDGDDVESGNKLAASSFGRAMLDEEGEITAYVLNPSPIELNRMWEQDLFKQVWQLGRIDN